MKYKYLILIILSAVLLTGCNLQSLTGGQQPSDEQNTVTEDESTADQMENETEDSMMEDDTETDMDNEPGEAMMAEDKVELTVDMFSFGYTPATLTAKPGQTLEITLTNSDGFHDFVIDELDVASVRTNTGEETTVTIEIPSSAEPGSEYAFYCSVGEHRAQGMEGVLTIK